MIKKIAYTVGAIALLFGLWGVYVRLFEGEQSANYGSYIGWGLWVAMYLFLAGLAAGAYMLATLDYLFNIPQFKGTGKAMLWAAAVTLPAGLASIGMDIRHIERICKVYLQPNFSSFLALMVWGYTIFLLLILLSLYLAFTRPEQSVMKLVMWIGLVVAVLVAGGVGFLLGGNASRLFWHVGLLPVQFPVFALASGAALMLVLVGWFGPKEDHGNRANQLWTLGILTVILSVVKLYFLFTDFTQSLYGGVPENVQAVQAIMFGQYSFSFWVVQIGLGTLLPILALVQPKLAKNDFIAGLMGVLLLIGYAVARILIIVPGQVVPMLPGLAEAFSGPKLTFEYVPSLMEWSVTSAVLGGAILALLIGLDRLVRFTEVKK